MSPEQKRALKDAHTALAKCPGYCGAAIAFFMNDFRDVNVSKHGVRDDLVDQALLSTIEQRHLARPQILVPPGYQNRKQRRHNGG